MAKTRVAVCDNGETKELFSVEENAQGGLTIVMKIPSPPPNSTWHTTGQRYSVHESLKSKDGGFSVKETREHFNRPTVENYSYCIPEGDRSILPICGILSAISPAQPVISTRRTGSIEVIYDGDINGSVFYVLIAARSGLKLDDLPQMGLQSRELVFSRYKLFVISGIFPSVGFDMPIIIPFVSLPPRLDGVEQKWNMPEDFPPPVSPTIDQLPFFIGLLVDRIADEAKKSFVRQAVAIEGPGAELTAIKHTRNFDQYMRDPQGLVVTNRIASRDTRPPPKGLPVHYLGEDGSIITKLAD